jgi:hypothetical protein
LLLTISGQYFIKQNTLAGFSRGGPSEAGSNIAGLGAGYPSGNSLHVLPVSCEWLFTVSDAGGRLKILKRSKEEVRRK